MSAGKTYGPTAAVKENPYHTRINGVAVGIGGDIEMSPKPPKIKYVIKEATAEQYKVAFDRGLKGVTESSVKKEEPSKPVAPPIKPTSNE